MLTKMQFLLQAQKALVTTRPIANEWSPDARLWAGMGLVVDQDRLGVLVLGEWLNMEAKPRNPTNYPGYAFSKMIEQAWFGKPGSQSPIKDPNEFNYAPGWKGGGRDTDEPGHDSRVVFGVSGTADDIDLKVGLALLSAFWENEVRALHHVGIRVPTKGMYNVMVSEYRLLGFEPINADVPDHLRTYFEIAPGMYIELQYVEDDKSEMVSFHLDVVDNNPTQLLIDSHGEHRLFEEGIQPVGVNRWHEAMSFMARSTEAANWVPGT